VTGDDSGISIVDQLYQTIAQYSAPIFLCHRSDKSILDNGMVFFLDIGAGPFGVSANHVFEDFKKVRNDSDLVCQIGDIVFDPIERIIEEDPESDIITFSINDIELNKIQRIAHKPPNDAWPPQSLNQGDDIVFCGYSGAGRIVTGDLITWSPTCCLYPVTATHDDYLIIQFNREDWVLLHSQACVPTEYKG